MTLPSQVIEFLLECLRTVSPAEGFLKGRFPDSLDWDLIAQQAERHGIVPLVFGRLKAEKSRAVPEETLEKLGRLSQTTAWRNLHFIHELLRILELFKLHRIEALTFKGPVLTALLYENPGLRFYEDLDFLVHPRDVARIVEILEADGYRPDMPIASPEQAAFLVRSNFEFNLLRDDPPVTVEIHWGMGPRWFSNPSEEADWWGRAIEIAIGGQTVRTLSCEDLLVLLSIHGAKHGWSKLKWSSDLARLVSLKDLDWTYVFDRAASRKCRRQIQLGLLLAADLFKTPVPNPILEEARKDACLNALVCRIRASFNSQTRMNWRALYLIWLKTRDNYCETIRDLGRFVFSPQTEDWPSLAIQSGLPFLKYIPRPVALFQIGLRSLKRNPPLWRQGFQGSNE
jgi:hypothetical protein